jgi:hypothetical protein
MKWGHRSRCRLPSLLLSGLLLAGACDDGTANPSADAGVGGPWRSELFPQDWAPATVDGAGRALHDFSYAGYRNGEAPLPSAEGLPVFDVSDYGADETGTEDATVAIQAAIDAAEAAGGGIVWVPAGLYRCDGLLVVQADGVVLRGAGRDQSRLTFTRHDGMTDQSHLKLQGELTVVAELPLVADSTARSAEVWVADASELAAGDDVTIGWVISDAFVADHGMTGVWEAFNGTWQPFFRRQVVAIDSSETPHRVILDVPLRYPVQVGDQATLRAEEGYLREVGVEHLGLANAVGWLEAWDQQRVHVVELDGVADGWVDDVGSFPAPTAPSSGPGAGAHLQSGGIVVRRSKRITVANTRLEKAQNRGVGGCGYLFEIRQSSEVLTRDCQGFAGRHNFIQNWGFGTSGCVWLRCHTAGGRTFPSVDAMFYGLGASDFHHSLAMANLVDSCVVDDGWTALNRQAESTGAGHTATETAFWNVTGSGLLRSAQYGWGYIVGTGVELAVNEVLLPPETEGSEPADWLEGVGRAGDLVPQSLYAAQVGLRLGRPPETAP